MSNILLVENSVRNAILIDRYLTSRNNKIDIAIDYFQAENKLEKYSFDATLINCFIPEITGSGRINLGKKLVDKMARLDTNENRMIKSLELFGKYISLEDPDIRKYTRFLIGTSEEEDISQNFVFKELEKLSILGKKDTTIIAENVLREIYRSNSAPNPDNFYEELIREIEKSEMNQPLGLLIAEKSEKLKLPFILNILNYSNKIILNSPKKYINDKKWNLLDRIYHLENGNIEKFGDKVLEELEEILKENSLKKSFS
jgi:CheY-like chemotaxis protein